jgi:hypothetical protein
MIKSILKSQTNTPSRCLAFLVFLPVSSCDFVDKAFEK